MSKSPAWRHMMVLALLALAFCATGGFGVAYANTSPADAPAIEISHVLKAIEQETDSLTGLPQEGRARLFAFQMANPSDGAMTRRLSYEPEVQGPLSFLYGWQGSPWMGVSAQGRGSAVTMIPGREGFTAEIRLEAKAAATVVLQLTNDLDGAAWRLWQPQAWDQSIAQAMLLRGLFAGAVIAAAAWLTGLAVLRFAAAPFWAALTMMTGLAVLLGQAGLAQMGEGGLLLAGGAFVASCMHFVIAFLEFEMKRPRAGIAIDGIAFAAFGFAATGSLGLDIAPQMTAFLAVLGAIICFGVVVLDSLQGSAKARALLLGLVLIGMVALAPVLIPAGLRMQVAQWPLLLDGGLVMGLLLIAFAATAPRKPALSDDQAADLFGEQRRAKEAEYRYALGMAAAHQGLWDWNVESDTLFVSPTVEVMIGMPQGSFGHSERAWAAVIHPEDLHVYEEAMASYRVQGNVSFSMEFRARHTRGELVWLQLKASCLAGRDGRATRCIGVVSDITARKSQEKHDAKDDTRDPVTGLTSRSLFLDKLDQVFATMAKAGLSPRGLVLAIDLERVKTVNDGMGHAAGDRFLKEIATRLGEILGPLDVLSRVGSDEFACLILPDDLGKDPNLTVARIKEVLAQPVNVGRQDVFPAASVGAVTLGPQHRQAGDALREAEVAMYHAKRGGRGGFELFNPGMKPRSTERLALDADLRRALERNEIDLFFQPIVHLGAGVIAGFEALIRWRHPARGLLTPGEFIPMAEETGLIVPLGAHVLTRAAAELKRWQTFFPNEEALFVSVNLSPKQLFRPEFLSEVSAVLTHDGPAPGTLKFEITESAMMENPDRIAQVLLKLKGMGAGLALDDFGTGYSSLSYLQRFPFDTIKVDRSFVAAMSASGDAPVIVNSIIALARNLKMAVVAEGVETQADAVRLAQMGCQYAQGFLFGAPMDSAAAYNLLALKGKVRREQNPPARGSGASALLR